MNAATMAAQAAAQNPTPSTQTSSEPTPDTTTTASASTSPAAQPSSDPAPGADPAPAATPLAAAATPAAEPAAAPAAATSAAEPASDPAPSVVEDYEIEVGDDSNLSQADLDAIATIASEKGLNKEQADALVTERETFLKQGLDLSASRLAEKHKNLESEFYKDLDFVGEKKAESFASISRAVSTFGDEKLVEALSDPNIGLNLPLAKFLKNIGDAMKDDGFEGKGAGTQPASSPEGHSATLQRMYPSLYAAENK